MNTLSAEPAHVDVWGFAKAPFESISDVFARMVAAQLRGGAALAIYQDGVPVVDLVGGDYPQRPLQLQYSASKAVAAVAAQHASRAGLLDLDAPIGDVWAPFRKSSTSKITPRMILSHQSGLPGVSQPLTIDEVVAGKYTNALEVQEPYWEPGTKHGYHTFSFGPLIDGVFTRALGVTVGEYVATHLAKPLGLELWLGIPEDLVPRVSPYVRLAEVLTPLQYAGFLKPDRFVDHGFAALLRDMTVFNRPDVMMKDWPSVNVVSGARDMARLFASTLDAVDGTRIIDAEGLTNLTAKTASGIDWVLGIPIQFGSGVQLAFPQLPYISLASFGHEGAGGSVVFADPETGIAVSFITDAYPACNGASIGSLALMSTIRHCLELAGR